ncbi:hypothetical protein VYJ29_003199 [Yersinia enterocolitica]|uniref:hypothetical protein n=1 Tax=Enterobacterales TaxID=91347 RepID=UPI00065D3A03|nr:MULTISPECIES: hypothetical protein [Enterobacterales]ELI7915042.1 hypothetical protein [Yersinia enterocolitica]ELI7927276.1 hypothetical protein [Yersinia enterocolitica]ELI7959627.1 hypothetical protein [Yersinia enterocolitica]ELI8139811.1 hypothetical protein [Yersinia enterocolitica]ELI8180486.1 hypothetical protein [Yersinia enterocolitica]
MDKLTPCEVSDVLFSLSRMLEVAQLLIGEPEGEDIGYELLEFAQQHAAKAAKNIEGVNYA